MHDGLFSFLFFFYELHSHGFALDWYSVGALLFELLTGLPPFYTNDKKQLFHNILRGHLVIPDYLSPNARDLIQRLLHRDPKQRLGSGPRKDREIFVRFLLFCLFLVVCFFSEFFV